MPRYIAFLRAINLGAVRKFPKEAIRSCVEAAGFTDVQTHINTGNVLVSTGRRSRASVERALEEAFLADRGFEVPTIAFRAEELRDVVETGEELAASRPDAVRHYVTLLKHEPTREAIATVTSTSDAGMVVAVSGRAVHVVSDHVLGQGGPQGDRLERLLGVGTTRNQTVLRAVVEKWCSP